MKLRTVLACLALLSCSSVYAMNHGFDPGDPGVQWFEGLKIPPADVVSCCGKGDAYPVDEYEKLPDGTYRVWIADGSESPYPDGTKRVPWDISIPIIVPAERVNKMEDDLDNPTDHGWLFFQPRVNWDEGGKRLPSTEYNSIYCFIRHPKGN